MSYLTNIAFRAGGSESAGSIAQNPNTKPCPTCGKVSFKADSFEYSQDQKKNKGVKTAVKLLAAAATVIGGLACAHKYAKDLPKCLKWLNNETFGKATKKCYNWCHTAKSKGVDVWESVKGKFSK